MMQPKKVAHRPSPAADLLAAVVPARQAAQEAELGREAEVAAALKVAVAAQSKESKFNKRSTVALDTFADTSSSSFVQFR